MKPHRAYWQRSAAISEGAVVVLVSVVVVLVVALALVVAS